MSQNIKPAQLTLTPHHLFYVLSRLEEIDIAVGSMNIRLESIHTDSSAANYVSFIHQTKSKRRSDKDSIHSVSSVRSAMSGMGALWSSFGLGGSGGATKSDKAKAAVEADLKYLYSAFTKLPSLRLSPDHRARLIQGYEEFPFDTAVPLYAFKNLQSLDIVDVDFRQFYGWDRLAEQLSLLTVKRANLDDPGDLITAIVLDDADKRRLRSTKIQHSPIIPWNLPSPTKSLQVGRANSDPGSPGRSAAESLGDSVTGGEIKEGDCSLKSAHTYGSPSRPSRPQSSYRHYRSYSIKIQRSGSGSSDSSERGGLPYYDGILGPLSGVTLPASKWRQLKYLSLADNALTSIPPNSLLPLANTLRSLNLSSNLFTEIPESLAGLTRLTSLDLSNCMIQSLQSLAKSPLPAITTLRLKYNRLASLAGIERLLSLENLNVQENRISDPMEAAKLTGLPNIRRVCVRRNPLTKRSNYRITIFSLFRSTPGCLEDIVIDESGPGYTERKLLPERIPELVRPPIIRPASPVQLGPPPKPRERSNVRPPSPSEGRKEERYADSAIGSNHRRRAPRRRIVDLSREEEQGSTRDTTALTALPPLLRSDGTGEKPTRAYIEQTSTLGVGSTNIESPRHLNTTADDSKERIEALKLEAGDKWLSVLKDQGWSGVGGGLPVQPIHGPRSQALVTGGGTLC
jgi:hypothetical protein